MRIWQKPISVELLTAGTRKTADEHLGIEFVEVGDDYIVGRVPVDERTRQPYGLLHGGVSVVLAHFLMLQARIGGFACWIHLFAEVMGPAAPLFAWFGWKGPVMLQVFSVCWLVG